MTISVGLVASLTGACNSPLIFNPSYLNQGTGEIFPLAPGDRSGFILVRANNATTVPVEFLITVEREVESTGTPGTTIIEAESIRLFTPSENRANDVGILVDCPAVRIGLGENLDRPDTEPAVFIDATDVGVGGLGVPAHVNPLDAEAGNFDCGDTIVFQAVETSGTVGGVTVLSFVLDDEELAQEITGIDTFVNARTFLEEQTLEEE